MALDTQQENRVSLFDIGISYRVSRRWTVAASLPIAFMDRINHRTNGLTQSQGIGDMSVGAKFWVFRPPTESRQNIQVGFSLKLPTGKPNVSSFITNVPGAIPTKTIVDQSIQLGDSGVGIALDYLAYKALPRRFTLYSTGVYLFNPRNTYTAPAVLPGSRQLSVPDQYLFRGGLGWAIPKVSGVALSFAGRVEGVPARDKIGREDGFRRPGYATSVEPGVQYARGRNIWSFSYVIAVYRNRVQSVPDKRSGPNVIGDAAFADGVLLIGFSRTL